MPDRVTVYKSPKGKYHLHPCCAGGNAEEQEIHEVKFLRLIYKGEVCKGCVGDLDEFALIVERDIIRKINTRPGGG